MLKNDNIVYEIAERTRAIGHGGIGVFHKMVCKLKLDRAINRSIELLKFHVPYHESDHVLNIAYNVWFPAEHAWKISSGCVTTRPT